MAYFSRCADPGRFGRGRVPLTYGADRDERTRSLILDLVNQWMTYFSPGASAGGFVVIAGGLAVADLSRRSRAHVAVRTRPGSGVGVRERGLVISVDIASVILGVTIGVTYEYVLNLILASAALGGGRLPLDHALGSHVAGWGRSAAGGRSRRRRRGVAAHHLVASGLDQGFRRRAGDDPRPGVNRTR